MTNIRHIGADARADLRLCLELMRSAFAYMDGVVDPPSSIRRLTVESLAVGPGEVWAIGTPPHACVVLTPRADSLYVGKLAVAGERRGAGLATIMMNHAADRARELGLDWLELQTRIELISNQQTFLAMGFEEVERTAHSGYSQPTSITYRRAV